MELNVKHLVNTVALKPNEYLLPLMETIVNSIQAVHERRNKDGLIRIIIHKEDSIQQNISGIPDRYISGFTIIDNGIGFNKRNFESFNKAFSDYKLKYGCKGIGRFVVLSAFDKMAISSIFSSNNINYRRDFTFTIDNEIEGGEEEKIEACETGTIINLKSYKPAFRKDESLEKIADAILHHSIIYFINGTAPKILVTEDIDNSEQIDLNDLFHTSYEQDEVMDEFSMKGEHITIHYIKNYSGKGYHKIHYTANSREVKTRKISSLIPSMEAKLNDSKGDYYISAYITSPYFDSNVNMQRNELLIPNKDYERGFTDKFSLEALELEIKKRLEQNFGGELKEIRSAIKDELENFVFSDGGIEYKHLLGIKGISDLISPSQMKDKATIDSALHSFNYELEREHKMKVNRFLNTGNYNIENLKEYQEELNTLINDEHKFSESKLSSYLIRRKTILKVLDKFIGYGKNKEYKYEKEIHNIVFPMGEDSDSTPFKRHNLWIIDEKLTFHQFICSDIPFFSNTILDSNSGEKPDILLFDRKFAFKEDDQSSIVIVEFKRPMRKFSGNTRKLEEQVLGYIGEIMEARNVDYRGRSTRIDKNTPKFGYIICDIDLELEDHLLTMQSYKRTPNGTFYKFHDGISLLIEIIPYDNLLNNANKRHKAFFKELGLDLV